MFSSRVGLAVALHAQVLAHDRVQRDLPEEVAVVPERVAEQDVLVGGEPPLVLAEAVRPGDDEDLAEGEGDALAELVLGTDRLTPPDVDVLVPAIRLRRARQTRAHGIRRQRELRVDPRLGPEPAGRLDVLEPRSERRLLDEAERVGRGERAVGGGVGHLARRQGLHRAGAGRRAPPGAGRADHGCAGARRAAARAVDGVRRRRAAGGQRCAQEERHDEIGEPAFRDASSASRRHLRAVQLPSRHVSPDGFGVGVLTAAPSISFARARVAP